MADQQTLSGPAAHNALAAAVQLYAGIMADHQRELALVKMQLDRMKVEYDELRMALQREREGAIAIATTNKDLHGIVREMQRQLDVHELREKART